MTSSTICLNMIVKNESHIIKKTLEHLHCIFKFDYWVICDTGSTDNTKDIIVDFFDNAGVSGELHDNEWKNFAHNRSKALEYAYDKTDYLFIFDADDYIHGDLKLPEKLTYDSYSLKFGPKFVYYRPLLINNRKKWKFKSVIHNYLFCLDKENKQIDLRGNYHIESRRLGNFNLDPLKYKKQAEVLEKEFKIEMDKKEDIGLAYRYAFYCGQSYRDFNDTQNAIKWYKKVVEELNNWVQEKYYSCIELGNLYKKKDNFERSIYYYLKSLEYDNERIEGVVYAFNYMKEKKHNYLAISLYERYKNYNRNIVSRNKLFVNNPIYKNMEFEFNCSIISYYIKGTEHIGYECCKKIIYDKSYSSKSYERTILNLFCKKYKSLLLNDEFERNKVLLCLTEYILEKNIKQDNKCLSLWKELYDVYDISKLTNEENKTIMDVALKFNFINKLDNIQILEETREKMCNYTFTKKEHGKTNELYNIYKHIPLTEENKELYLYIRRYEAISAYHAKAITNGYDACKSLILNDFKRDRNNMIFNFASFYIQEIHNEDEKIRSAILNKLIEHILESDEQHAKCIHKKICDIFKRYIPNEYKHKIEPSFLFYKKQLEENKKVKDLNNKKVLIYTGFSNKKWNYTYSLNNALGGSERAVVNISHILCKDYDVYVSGDVDDEIVDNVTYINRYKLKNVLETTEFNTIIVSRYISFFLLYPDFNCKKLVLYAHDTDFMNRINGSNITEKNIMKTVVPYIDNIVVLTNWHKKCIHDKYPFIPNSKFSLINNGINTSLFPLVEYKQKNSFIYSSCAYRGLDRLIELWPSIVEKIPDATLHLCSYNKFPNNEKEEKIKSVMDTYDNITHYGRLPQEELYNLMSFCEFWLYPTNFCETSCITAMEMLMNEVICIYYPLAGLNDTLGDYGIPISRGKEVETITKLTEDDKIRFRKEGKEYALSCSWENRAVEWKKQVLYNNNNNNIPIKIVNLKRREDRKEEMINKLKNVHITEYEFIEAVDGSILEPTQEIKKQFEGNNFNYRKGIIGCALSHMKIFNMLVNDKENDYYIILEDDVSFVDGFKEKMKYMFEYVQKNNLDYLFIGEEKIKEEMDYGGVEIEKSLRDTYGAFGYIISKNACKKFLDYYAKNPIYCAIDDSRLYTDINIQMYLPNKYIVKSVSYQQGNPDTDIQNNFMCFNFNNIKKIGIFNSFYFHYEMFGFIIDYAKLHNYQVDIYNHPNAINNNDLGWSDFYKDKFNNFKQIEVLNFNGNVQDYELFFVTTDDGPYFKKEWIRENVICLNHYYKVRSEGFKHYFNIAPFMESKLEYIYPCYNIYNSEDKKIDDEFINVTVIGGRFKNTQFDINRLMCKNINKKLRINIITKDKWRNDSLYDIIKDKTKINDINYIIDADTKSMFNTLKNTQYLLLTASPNNDHNTCKSTTGSIQLFLSCLCVPIVCTSANKHLKFKNSIEFDMDSNEPIYVDDNIDFKNLEKERDLYIHKRNMVLDNVLYENKYIKNDIKKIDKIPKRIVQTWERKNVIPELQEIINSWKINNPDYEYVLYDSVEREQFIKEYFNEDVIYAYNTLNSGAFKVDLFRICQLYVKGGFYCDLDSICIKSIDTLLDDNPLMAIPVEGRKSDPIEGNHCLLSGFILSQNKNPILLRIIHRIVENVKTKNIYGSLLDITGPGLAGLETNKFLNRYERCSFIGEEGVHTIFTGEKIKLLKFEKKTEYIRNVNGDILFQNKNGNTLIKMAYKKEIEEIKQSINFISWINHKHDRNKILNH